jgi:hypothetical protein
MIKRPDRDGGKEKRNADGNQLDSSRHTPLPKIDLRDARAVRRELAKLYREARAGLISTSDATRLGHLLELMRRMFETTDLEVRLELLERTLSRRNDLTNAQRSNCKGV